MQYRLVVAEYELSLEAKVSRLLSEGWQPQGGVSVVESGRYGVLYKFYQAMILKEKEK